LHLDSKRNERRVLRLLSELRKRAGKVRDMDVLTGYASSLHVDKDQDCHIELLEHLGSARYRYAKKLSQEMRQSRPALNPRLKRTAKRLEKLMPNEKDGRGRKSSNGATEISAEAAATALKLAIELENPPTLNKNNLHPYRLKVKELRNLLQLADHPGNQAFINALGEVKDSIGEWHDWVELVAIANDLLDHGPGCKLLQELSHVSARKYERALSLANKLRKDFLGASSNRKTSARDKRPLPRPVLEATAAIAS